jgi:CRISPR system Cascade subunit CasA
MIASACKPTDLFRQTPKKTMALDLLIEPILSWRVETRHRRNATLPGVLTRLASGELADFPRVRAHQLEPWCMFLTQLAAIALHRSKHSDPRMTEEQWRAALLALTGGAHEPWSLVVDDLSKAAFFQPPVPERSIGWWNVCEYPDDLDVLVTSKAHDVKTSLIHPDDAEAWLYALCTLQTMQGYPGRGYTRIARMNGGYGNRPRVGLASDLSLTSRFLRDVTILLDTWPALLGRGYSDQGIALVWTVPWNGRSSLSVPDLAPHFIEICWRVRCRRDGRLISCAYSTTQVRRCAPEVETGDVGDPWIPIERSNGAALTIGPGGFDYRRLTQILFSGDFEPARAQEPRLDDGDPILLVATALARGQGKTEGLHQRTIVLAGALRRKLGEPEARAALGRRAAERVTKAALMRSKVLYPALTQLSPRGMVPEDRLDTRVDDIFFDHLSETIEMTDEDARLAFDRKLEDLARDELQAAIDRCALADARRFKVISDAERMFSNCLRKHFPDVVRSPDVPETAAV